MPYEVLIIICGIPTFIGTILSVTTFSYKGKRHFLLFSIGIPVLLWIVSMAWLTVAYREFIANGGYQEIYSTIVEVTEKPLKDGGSIQIVEYEKDQDVHVVNVTKAFGKTFKEGTKIRLFEKEDWRVVHGLGFRDMSNREIKYEVVKENE